LVVEVLLQHGAELLVDEVVRLFCLAGALVEGLVDGVQLVIGEQGHLVLGNPGDDPPCNKEAFSVVVDVPPFQIPRRSLQEVHRNPAHLATNRP